MAAEMHLHLEVPFPSSREAEIACNTLRVDKEPKRGGVTKRVTFQDKLLIADFSAAEARKMRVSVNGFMDYLALISQTMEKFGPPVPTPS